MNLLPTSDQQQIVDSVAAFMAEQMPVARYRELHLNTPSLSAEQLQQVVDLGWFSLGLEEEHGGLGCSLVEEALLFREIGRHVGPLGILAGVLGARVAALAGQSEVVERILSGQARVAIAVATAESTTAAEPNGQVLLLDAEQADFGLLVDDSGAALFELAGLSGRALASIEFHLPMHEVSLKHTGTVAFVATSQERLIDRTRLLAAAMQVGGAEASRDMAVEYAKTREQFGRPIGSFQAIKHMCSDMAMRCEEAASQVFYASLCIRDGHSDGQLEVLSASYLATRAAQENSGSNIQIHGGMGMTAEVDAHHYLKRAHILDQIMGGASQQLDLLMAGGMA